MKRLALSTEDHPLVYADFEGTILEGNYGAGKVEIWGKGTFVILENEKDKIVINLNGNRLNGKYCLIKFKDEENNWMLFKCK